MRHELVKRELLKRYPGTLVISIPGSPTCFAKVKDPRIPDKRASDVLLEDLDVFVNNGEPMGETNEFIRLNLSGYSLNLSGYSQGLVEFLNRLAGRNKYAVQDVFIASLDRCNSCIVASKALPNTVYIVNPGDCRIDADANNGPLEIYFPPFIDYEGSRVFSVKKIDRSDHPVVVKTRDVTLTLKKQDESVDLQWSETIYRQGRWQLSIEAPKDVKSLQRRLRGSVIGALSISARTCSISSSICVWEESMIASYSKRRLIGASNACEKVSST